MDIINFLFSIHDYNVVGDLFLTDWSMSMVFVCAFVMYIILLPFTFITKKKAKAFHMKHYPDEEILLVSTVSEAHKIFLPFYISFGYGFFFLPFVFFKNLNHVAFLYKEFVPLTTILYSLFFICPFIIPLGTSAYIFTNKAFREIMPYKFYKKLTKTNEIPVAEILYEKIKSINYKRSITMRFVDIRIDNSEKAYVFPACKHLKQAQEIIKTYMERNRNKDTKL